MTATFPTFYLPPLCRLLTIPLLTADSILRGSEIEFQQREIEMRTSICLLKGQFVSKGLTLLAKFIRDNQLSSAVVFCNYRKQSQHFRDHLEWKLNELKLNVDVIHINGSLHKTDKFWRICLFCDEDHISKADYRVGDNQCGQRRDRQTFYCTPSAIRMAEGSPDILSGARPRITTERYEVSLYRVFHSFILCFPRISASLRQ